MGHGRASSEEEESGCSVVGSDIGDASAPPAWIGRRRFMTLASQIWLGIPAASWLLGGCGGDSEERAATDTATGADGRRAAAADETAEGRPRAEAPAQQKPRASEQAPAQAASPSPDAAPAAEDALVTEIPAMAGLVKTVNYQHQTPKPDQRCANCELYTKKTDERGSCKLFAQGLVEAGGWCTSWIKKASAA